MLGNNNLFTRKVKQESTLIIIIWETVSTNMLDNAHRKYKYNKPHVFYSNSSCILSPFIVLIFFFLITDLVYIVPQATAYVDRTSNSLNATKIFFEKSGGLAGISSNTMVDTHSLSPDEAHKIQGMIDNAKGFFYQPSKLPPAPQGADYYKYKVRVETEEGKEYSIDIYQLNTPTELKPLIIYLDKLLQPKQ